MKDYGTTTWEDVKKFTPAHILWAIEAMDNEIRVVADGDEWLCIQGGLAEGKVSCGKTASEAFANWITEHGEPKNPYVNGNELTTERQVSAKT